MRGYSIEGIIGSGLDLAPLLLIPAAALLCAIVLTVAILRRRPVAAFSSILAAAAVVAVATSLRSSAIAPGAVDVLVLQVPLAMMLGAVPAVGWLAFRSVRSPARTTSARTDSPASANIDTDAVVRISAAPAAPAATTIDARQAPALQNAA